VLSSCRGREESASHPAALPEAPAATTTAATSNGLAALDPAAVPFLGTALLPEFKEGALIGGGEPGNELQMPMAVVILGGRPGRRRPDLPYRVERA
jgi:hypothetical protein